MAKAFVATGISDGQEKLEDMIEMITFKSNPTTELSTRLEKCSGERNIKILKIICVGDCSGGWSEGVFIKDYIAGTISKNPENKPVIGAEFFLKIFHVNSNNDVRLQIWNIVEQERFWDMRKSYYRNSKGGIVFWGAGSRSMESAIRWKEDIPIVLLVDGVFKTPERWIGEGLVVGSTEEVDTFCSEHGFVAWFEMLGRGAGEGSVFGQAMATLVNRMVSTNCGEV